MRAYRLERFDLAHVRPVDLEPPQPGPAEVLIAVRALSLNYRDLLIVKGQYNPRFSLPAIPLSDGAGEVVAVGAGVSRVRVGDRVMSHFVSGWIDGPYRGEYVRTTLGLPGPGLAAERVALPADAVVPLPRGYTFEQAAALPIAALTAWSALVTKGSLRPGQWVLTLGTGGVSIYALQIAKKLGASVVITSRSDEKLARARQLGADHTINYASNPEWPRTVTQLTDGGAHVTVETGGAGTFDRSLLATRPGGVVATLGALTGLRAEINLGTILSKELRIAGIMTGSRAAFEELVRFLEEHHVEPVIDRVFPWEELPAALRHMEAGAHFGKIIVTVGS